MIDIIASFCQEANIPTFREEPLSAHTTFRIGGAADLFCEVTDKDNLRRLLEELQAEGLPFILLGRGSNVLFSDAGYRGVVIHVGNGMDDIRLLEDGTVYCESGARLIDLCGFALEHSLTGLEFAYGIPGSVGGAIYMNAGAYGGEISNVIERVDHLTMSGEEGYFDRDNLRFSYRHSAYCSDEYAIVAGYFRLNQGSKKEIQAKMLDIMNRRKEKQPLDYPSAGSTFKRPAGEYASELIDRCGLKGLSVGGAAVSEKHAGFVINRGGATSKDVLELISLVTRIVEEKTGIRLEPEVKLIGDGDE